jgi:two-component system cell cycle response regulator DivK
MGSIHRGREHVRAGCVPRGYAAAQPAFGVLRPPLVLLVEPHADTSDMYCDYFGYHNVPTLTASSAAEAMTIASTATPKADVIVTNITLPGGADGIELVTRLRHHVATQHVPIVVMSARALSNDEQRARDAGCDHFALKPCLPDELLTRVMRLARPLVSAAGDRR